jgi:hypothetical protein
VRRSGYYDKIYRKDVLFFAWKCCRANGGAPGVDGVTFEQIEARGVGDWLEELTKEFPYSRQGRNERQGFQSCSSMAPSAPFA